MARTIAKDHDSKRRQILAAAAQVFAQHGFDGASMSMLAAECGISKANIYHYYSGKDDILFDVLDAYLAALRDRLCALPQEGPPEVRLHAMIREILLAYQGADHEHQVQTRSMGALSEPQQARLRGVQRDMVDALAARIDAAAPGVFAGDKAKLRAATMSVFGMLNWYYMWNSGAGSAAREDYADLVSKLILKGICGI